ncbi:hypothetical protein SETIT_8G041600v2 [Setaria italica]|uniref:Zinc finger PHD-type domain-containing protein n=1 Tax=Setaria italica TaxID=4555 RepID=A0A368S477_SETIT|nr:uncharacterized protein LOC101775226 isoform X1 [Setaria italica]RCV37171.1 hypothetical protein SETIT_8G041600v2 [Setaria italica]
MDAVCEVCGDVGYRHLLVQCNSCKNATRHLYCLNPVIYDGSSIEWLCEDCLPKPNEVAESLKWMCDDHHPIQWGSFIINEPNVDGVEVTKEPWSWGHRRHRSHKAKICSIWGRRRHRSRKARRDSTDACTKHFPSGGTFNSSEMFVEEKAKHNDVEKEGESKKDHLIYQLESADGSSHSAPDLAAEIRKTMVDVEPTMNTMECMDLSKEKDSCSLSLNYVEGSIPLNCDVERSHPFVRDDSCPTVPIVEQEDGSSHSLEIAKQSHPLEVVNPDGTSCAPLDPALKIEEQGTEAGLFASVNNVEQSRSSFTDGTAPTLPSEEHGDDSETSKSWEQPDPLEVVKPQDDAPKSILGSKPPSNYSQPMQVSDLGVENTDVLDPSKEYLDLKSMSKTVEPSSSSNGGDSAVEKYHAEKTECLLGTESITPALDNVQGSSPLAEPSSSSNGGGEPAVEKNSTERTECLSGMETVTPALDNDQGSSTSTAKDCLVSDVDNSDEANRSGKHFLCTIENERGQLEVYCSHNDHNESSDPKSGLKGRDTQNDVPKASVSAVKNVVCSQLSQMEDVNSESLPSNNFSPCKATQSSFKKQPNRDTQHHTKHQKIKLIVKDRNADHAQLKNCRPSKQLDHTCLSASLELSSEAKELNDAVPRCSSSAQTFENAVPMKRKRLIVPHSEDAEAMHVENLNPPCSENEGQVRMHKRHVESAVMNQRRSAKNHEEVLRSGNSNEQHVNNHTQTKKQRRATKDKKAPVGNPSVRCAPNDAEQLASEAAGTLGHCSLSRMPVVSAPTDQQSFICPQPIDRPKWTGIMKIGQEYIPLAAHLSNQASKKVQELSLSLPPVMKVTKHSELKAWQSRWEALELTAENISLYFFSDNMRPNKELDRLVQYVTDHSIVLKYVVGLSKLLIFPSVLLPEQCQMFQGRKHYLWGVFRRRLGRSKAATQVKQKVSTVSKSHTSEKKDHQDKMQSDAQNQEMHVSKGTMPSGSQPTPDAVHDVGTETDLGDHKKPQANSEAPPTKLLGLVVAQTPRSEQFIKELENEGALVFAVKGIVKPAPERL